MNEFLENNEEENNVFGNVIEMSSLMSKVFMWLFVAIGISGITAFAVSTSETLLNMVFGNIAVFFILAIAELILVIVLSRTIQKISYTTAIIGFIAYSIINGLTLSVVFLAYELGSIALVFFITAGLFGLMAFIGYTTSMDLSKIGNICMIGLIGIIIAGLINLFIGSSGLETIICIVGIVVFIGLTAYDIQKIKVLSQNTTEEQVNNLSIVCALTIYLDFINLFLKILSLMGKRRD